MVMVTSEVRNAERGWRTEVQVGMCVAVDEQGGRAGETQAWVER